MADKTQIFNLFTLRKDMSIEVADLTMLTEQEFRNVVKQDKKHDKREAAIWFLYIFIVADCRSHVFLQSPKEKHKAAVRMCNLGVDWKPTREIQIAAIKYEQIQEEALPSLAMWKALNKAMINTRKTLDRINTLLEEILDNAIDAKQIEQAVANIATIQGLSKEIPNTYKTIKELENGLKKEMHSVKTLRGGGDKGDFEDPSDILDGNKIDGDDFDNEFSDKEELE
jgi:hypothetical protein